jgi:hypothetical protein
MSGTITAYKDGQVVIQKSHKGASEREKIKETWRHLYGKAYDKFNIVDTPDPPRKKKVKSVSGIPKTYKEPKFSKNRSQYWDQ